MDDFGIPSTAIELTDDEFDQAPFPIHEPQNSVVGQVAYGINTTAAVVAGIDVYLVPLSWACYGWQYYGTTSEICIPAISVARLRDVFDRSYVSLADVLRHEYAHALADTHRGLFRSARFQAAFHASHEDEAEFEFDPEFHFS